MRLFLRQPQWTRFLPGPLVVNVATLGPLGRLPAPGTWGSAAGLAWYLVACVPAGWMGTLAITVIGFYLGVAFCGEAEKRLGKIDPSEVILDEFTVMPLTLAGLQAYVALPRGWVLLLLAFAVFRFFDILKPLGIAKLQRFPGGWGVMLDDFAAALASCGVLNAVFWLTPLGAWVRDLAAAAVSR
jgi:phosphatidylglycerophosphatase A